MAGSRQTVFERRGQPRVAVRRERPVPWWLWGLVAGGLIAAVPSWSQTVPGSGSGTPRTTTPPTEAGRAIPDRVPNGGSTPGMVVPPTVSGAGGMVIAPPSTGSTAGVMPILPPPGSVGGDKVVPK